MINKKADIENLPLLWGIKEQDKSFKLYESEEDKYILLVKRYFLNFCYSKNIHEFENLDHAEDYLMQNTDRISYGSLLNRIKKKSHH